MAGKYDEYGGNNEGSSDSVTIDIHAEFNRVESRHNYYRDSTQNWQVQEFNHA